MHEEANDCKLLRIHKYFCDLNLHNYSKIWFLCNLLFVYLYAVLRILVGFLVIKMNAYTISLYFILICAYPTIVFGQSIEEILVTKKTVNRYVLNKSYASFSLGSDEINGAALSVDAILKKVPGFSLFRRQASRAAHPTTQGASLRGLGPNGAGRVLVLHDGIPLNDPFGGWVDWGSLSPYLLDNIVVTRGGGAGLWGSSALTGVINISSKVKSKRSSIADFRYGSASTYSVNGLVTYGAKNWSMSSTVFANDTAGYFLLSPKDRGAADKPLAREFLGGSVSFNYKASSGLILSTKGSLSFDSFINGADQAKVNSESYTLSVRAYNQSTDGSLEWEVNIFSRVKEFKNIFVKFDAEREVSTPVLNQFDVPAYGLGGNLILRWKKDDYYTLETGVDVKLSDGETNELFRNLGSGFTRRRVAGGEQLTAGAFLEANFAITSNTGLNIGGRVDYWRQGAGQRNEFDIVLDRNLVDKRFSNRGGFSVNGRVGLKKDLSPISAVEMSAYSAYRVPTLNELYRPFRVGNDITEANPALENERLMGLEASSIYSSNSISINTTVFYNIISDPVLNVTLTNASGFNREFGVFIPKGGSLRQRRNIQGVSAWGFEVDSSYFISESVSVGFSYLHTNPKLRRDAKFPKLSEKILAQVAKHQGMASYRKRFDKGSRLELTMFFSSSQFEDDLNTRVLNSNMTFDSYLEHPYSDNVDIYFSAQNIFNNRAEAGKRADGLVSLGAPRFLWVGMKVHY